jgi:NADPH-dependent glutamate synthase beta subunit-like oxidoreductase
VAVEGRTHKPVLEYEKCETCGVCLQACPSEVLPSMRKEEHSLRGKVYEHSDLEPRLNLGKVFGAPRCQMACPIQQDVRGYLRFIAEGKYREALALIREVNPLPSVCGYVCHHPCEAACTRGRVDDPLSIRSLKRFLAEYDTGNVSPPAVEAHKNKKVVIVGSGPAGLTAGHELAKKGYELEIVESYSEPGGLLAWAIPKFRLPREVLKRDIDHIRRMGVQFRTNTCFGQDMGWDDVQNGQADAVIIATGTQKSSKLRIKHEDDFRGYFHCLAFLRRYNEGDAISLGPRVLVVGGGNAAVDSARSAIRLGATEVTIVYRRGREEMPADREEIDEALREGIRIQYLTAPVRTLGDKGRVSGIECVRTELKDADASGRRKPVPVEGSEFVLKADSIILALGQQADYEVLGSYAMDRESLGTTEKNVFVAGDFVNGPTTVVEAMASGKRAAEAVEQYLEGKDS